VIIKKREEREERREERAMGRGEKQDKIK